VRVDALLAQEADDRPGALTDAQQDTIRDRLSKGESVAALAKELKTSRQTIMRARDRAPMISGA